MPKLLEESFRKFCRGYNWDLSNWVQACLSNIMINGYLPSYRPFPKKSAISGHLSTQKKSAMLRSRYRCAHRECIEDRRSKRLQLCFFRIRYKYSLQRVYIQTRGYNNVVTYESDCVAVEVQNVEERTHWSFLFLFFLFGFSLEQINGILKIE